MASRKTVTRADGSKYKAGSAADPSVKSGAVKAIAPGKVPSTPSVSTSSSTGGSKNNYSYSSDPNYVPDSLVLDNQARAKALGIDIPGLTASSGTLRDDEQKLGSEIMGLSAPDYAAPSNNTKYIKDMEDSISNMLSGQEQQINRDFEQVKLSTEAAQKGEVGSTSTMLARAGGYLGNSGSAQGVVLNLAASHRAEIAGIESKRQAALQAAREAYNTKKFEIAKLKLDEAKRYEQEVYNRQQDFFKNTITALGETRTVANQERDDARAVLTNIISNASGQSFDELDAEARAVLETNAKAAGYPLSVVKSLLEAPKAERSKIDTLIRSAVGKGAPAELLDAAASAGSYVEAAKVLAPYLASKSGSGSSLSVKYIPASLSTPVSQFGASAVYDSLLSDSIPQWFVPVLEQALPGPVAADLGSMEAKQIWSEFRALPDVSTFKKQVDKEIGIPVTTSYGAGLPATDTADLSQ